MARPREYDEGEVLDRATDVFWRLGYDGASMAELTRAMRLASPSIYAAFGSKRGLFDAVLGRYAKRRAAYVAWLLSGTTAREVAERMLLGAVEWLTDPNEPLGCLSIQSGMSAGVGNQDVPSCLAGWRARLEATLRDRFERARNEGDLSADQDPAALARYIQTVFLGLGIQAAAGVPRDALTEVAGYAMKSWPATGCVEPSR